MPVWLISMVLNLVLKFGIPLLMDWLKKKFGIGLNSQTVQVLSDYVEESKTDKRAARRRALHRLKQCHGVACETKPVGLD